MVNQKKNKNFAPEPKFFLDLGSGAKFFFCRNFSKSLLDLGSGVKKNSNFSGSMVNQKKNKNFAPEPKSLLDLGSGANFFLPMVNQKRLRLRGVEGPLYRHASEGILSSLSP